MSRPSRTDQRQVLPRHDPRRSPARPADGRGRAAPAPPAWAGGGRPSSRLPRALARQTLGSRLIGRVPGQRQPTALRKVIRFYDATPPANEGVILAQVLLRAHARDNARRLLGLSQFYQRMATGRQALSPPSSAAPRARRPAGPCAAVTGRAMLLLLDSPPVSPPPEGAGG